MLRGRQALSTPHFTATGIDEGLLGGTTPWLKSFREAAHLYAILK